MSLNIGDIRQRVVKCVEAQVCKEAAAYFPNAEKLEVGKLYNVFFVEMKDWYTSVYLKEFPNLGFNSLHFDEVDGYTPPKKGEVPQGANRKELLQDYLRIIGREAVLIYQARILPPKLICSRVEEIKLSDYKERLAKLAEDDVFIIGRPSKDFSLWQDVAISKYGGLISRVQAFITCSNGMYTIYDPSINGNEIAF